MPRQTTNPLAEQMRQLAAEQARLERELAAAEKEARRKPRPVRPSLEPGRRIKVNTGSAPVILPPRPITHQYPGEPVRTAGKKRRKRKSEVRYERTKFLLLCVLLIALILFVWKNLP